MNTIATPIKKPRLYCFPPLWTLHICTFGLINDMTSVTGDMTPCQIPRRTPATRACSSAVLTCGFGPGAETWMLTPGMLIWPLGTGVPD